MKQFRVLALGSILILSFATGALAQTQNTIDSDQPTAQSEDKGSSGPILQTTDSDQQSTQLLKILQTMSSSARRFLPQSS